MSSAELSIEISHIVTRAMGGEPVDLAGRSEELAARFSELGMSAELIGKAIARAAGMVGIALEGADEREIAPAQRLPSADPQDGRGEQANGSGANGAPVTASARASEAKQAAALRRVFLRE